MKTKSKQNKESKINNLSQKSTIHHYSKIERKRNIEEDNSEITVKKKKIQLKKNNKSETKDTDNEIVNSEPLSNENNETEDNKKENNEKKEIKEKSKRCLKKEKAEFRATEAKKMSKKEMAQKSINYVLKWKHAKSEWKFEKLRQIWLIDNILNEEYIEDNIFLIILEYFEKCKGFARQKLINTAMASVKKVEDRIENNEEIVETKEYKRARQLLQFLPNE